MDYKTALGALTIAIAFISYGLYFRNIFRGKTRPHAISWLVWSVLSGVTFLTQTSNGAGAGGWITGFTAIVAMLIFMVAVVRGEKSIQPIDWYCVAGAMVSLSFWYLNRHGASAAVFASITFMLGFVPTYRKSFNKPRQETATTFALNGTKFLIAIAALDKFNTATLIYPIFVVLTNYLFVAELVVRRRMVRG